MAVEFRIVTVTVPAGTPIANPQLTKITLPARKVERVEVQVPPGPRGEVGFRLGSSGVQFIPYDLGGWLITNNEVVPLELDGLWDSGAWEFTAYNTGTYAHTLTVRFHLGVVQQPGRSTPAPLTAAQLGAVPVAAGAPSPAGPVQPLPVPPPLPPPPPLR